MVMLIFIHRVKEYFLLVNYYNKRSLFYEQTDSAYSAFPLYYDGSMPQRP